MAAIIAPEDHPEYYSDKISSSVVPFLAFPPLL